MKTRKEVSIQCWCDKPNVVCPKHPKPQYTSTPIDADALMVILLGNGYLRKRAAYIVRAVSSHKELLEMAHWIRASFKKDERPGNLDAIIAKAEGK